MEKDELKNEKVIERSIWTFALQNALEHDGTAQLGSVMGSVMGSLMGSNPQVRSRAREIALLVKNILEEINNIPPSEQEIKLRELAPEYFETKKGKVKRESVLPPLPNTENGVIMRFAPGPSGPLHIGHTRAAIINDEYVKRYCGKLIIRLEDTNPRQIDPSAYKTILEDLDWLGIEYNKVIIQSERFDRYIEWAEKICEMGKAYVCTCPVEEWRELKNRKLPCKHRDIEPDVQMKEWEKMKNGTYQENQASLVIKTDLEHKNPAVRDFVAMRICTNPPHPRTGTKYRVYPLYNFSVVIDDHLMGCTHILRGKDHLNNTIRQKYVYRYLGWETPEFHHYGWVSIKDTLLKTSSIRKGIEDGTYQGWDDIRLGTLKTMAKRGISPEAIRKYWINVGANPVDVQFSWENLYSFNKNIIEPLARRYFFVRGPSQLRIKKVDSLVGNAPLHPSHHEMGNKKTVMENGGKDFITLLLDSSDAKWAREQLLAGQNDNKDLVKIRLKDLCNVVIQKMEGNNVFVGNYAGTDHQWARQEKAKIMHWVPGESTKHLTCVVHKPDGSMESGMVECHVKDNIGKVVQFERYGFVAVEMRGEKVVGHYTHG